MSDADPHGDDAPDDTAPDEPTQDDATPNGAAHDDPADGEGAEEPGNASVEAAADEPRRVESDAAASKPATTSPETRQLAAVLHASALLSFVGIPSIVGPLVIWLLKRDDHAMVDRAGRDAINFHISMYIWTLVVGIIGVLTCGIGMLLAIPLVLVDLIFPIIVALKANAGVEYRYPMTVRFL